MKRTPLLDILKGLCIIFIILDHYTLWGDLRLQLLFPYWITMAVPILMIILGYQYAGSFYRHNIDSFHKAYKFHFVFDKFIRYSIPFWIAYILEFIISAISNGPRAIILTWIKGLFTGGWGPGSYYYPILIQFIFVFPLIYFLICRFKFSGVMICCILNFAYELLQHAIQMNSTLYKLLIFRYLLLIAYGCYQYLNQEKVRYILAFLSLVIGGSFIYLYHYKGYTPIILTHWTQTSSIAVLFILPIVGFMLRSSWMQKISCKPLEYIGKASYNIFLVQMVYFNYVAPRLYTKVSSLVICNVINLCIILLAGILFYIVEHKIDRH